MTLEILISTIDDGLLNVCNVIMPQSEDIYYLISWEQSVEKTPISVPNSLIRSDIRIITLSGLGLSRNRNNAMKNAIGDICLIADDDVTYDERKVRSILEVFEEHPTLDLATFKYASVSHDKSYPSYSFDLRHKPRNYYPCSIEIAFKRTSIQDKIAFNELMGLGTPYLGSGEDEIFILDAVYNNLNCKYFPVEIVTHNHKSTFQLSHSDPKILRSQGALLKIYYPKTFWLHYLVLSIRLKRRYNTSIIKSQKEFFSGYRYAKLNGILDKYKNRSKLFEN